MFINNINPVLLNLGVVQIRYYGLVYALGFLISYFFLSYVAKKGRIKGLNQEKTADLLFFMMIGMLIGARLFYFLFFGSISNPLEFFYIWHGGMSFHGALTGMIIAILFYCRKHNISFYKVVDILVIPAAFLFLGRIANFINGELVGIKTTVPWCVVFPNVDQYCRHPSQFYEAGKNLLIFFTLVWLYNKKKLKDGILFWTFVLMYGVLRFIINFWREDPRIFGISTGQVFSLLMVIVSLWFLYGLNKKA